MRGLRIWIGHFLLILSLVVGFTRTELRDENGNQEENYLLLEDFKNFLTNLGIQFTPSTTEKDLLLKFQLLSGLEETGIFDEATLDLIQTPRCGVIDEYKYKSSEDKDFRRRKRTTDNNEIVPVIPAPPKKTRARYKWNKKYITYRVSQYTTQSISPSQIDKDLARAFKLWEEHVNLKFVHGDKDSEVDIEIRFVFGEHGDGTPFTGERSETLGHAYPPGEDLGGDIHFNDNFTWSEGTTFLHTATHEIGHALGLTHVMIRTAIMSPYQGDSSTPVVLDPDDIRQIEALYGPKDRPAEMVLAPENLKEIVRASFASSASTSMRTPTTTTTTQMPTTTKLWRWYSTRTTQRPTTTTAFNPTLFTRLPVTSNQVPEPKTTTTTAVSRITISPKIETTTKQLQISTISDSMSSTEPTTTTTTTTPSDVENAIEPSVYSGTKSKYEVPVIHSWTKFRTSMVPNVTEAYVPRVMDSSSDLPPPTTDIVFEEQVPTVFVQLLPKVTKVDIPFPTTSNVVPPNSTAESEAATTTTNSIPYENDERIYFCDSNELCSKKELEENLTEDILALGSGNFELVFDEASEDYEADIQPLNPDIHPSSSTTQPKTGDLQTSTLSDIFLENSDTIEQNPKVNQSLNSHVDISNSASRKSCQLLVLLGSTHWILFVLISR